jgi:hypothetical protein
MGFADGSWTETSLMRLNGLLAAAIAAAAPAAADVLVLEDGKRIEGEISESGDAYEVKTKYGSLTVQKSMVRSRIPPAAKVLADAESARAVAKMFLKEAESVPDAAGRQAKADAARALLEQARKTCLEAKDGASAPEAERLGLAVEALDGDLRAARALAPPDVAASLQPPSPPATPPVAPPAALPAAPAAARVPPSAAPPRVRRPEPTAAELKAAEQEIRALYRADYAKKAPADLLAFARKLFHTAHETADSPAAQFVLYRDAADLAAQAGDAERAMAAIDRLAAGFEVDELALKTAALAIVAKAAREPEEQAALASASLALADEAVAADQYDAASGLAVKAESAARLAKDAPLLAQASAHRKEIDALRAAWAAVKADAKTLETRPDDPAACLAVGRFLCFTKGDWERGLPMLAKGSDAALKAVSEQDLAAPAAADAQVALADGWWDAAVKGASSSKARLQERAVHWYGAALAKLEGIAKIKAEKRIQEWEKLASPGSASAGSAVDLLAWIDPAECSIPSRSRWSFKGRVLVSGEQRDDMRFTRLQIPCIPPAEYDLTTVVECRKAGGPFAVGLVAGGRQFAVAVDGVSVAAGLFGGKDSKELASRYPGSRLAWTGAPFAEGKPSTVVCSVRRASLRVTVNGQVAIDWKGPPWAEAAPAVEWDVPNKQCLFLVSRDVAVYEVSKISIQTVGGGAPRRVSVPVRAPAPSPTR